MASKKPLTKRAKQVYLVTAGFFLLVYLIILFIYIHIALVQRETPGLDFATAMSRGMDDAIKQPFAISPFPVGPVMSFLGYSLLAGGFAAMLIYASRLKRHDMNVHGRAKWLTDINAFNMRFSDPVKQKGHDGPYNMILSQELFMCLDNRSVDRNMNVLVIGGAGSGKSYKFVGPNLMQANTSYVITDPSGGLFGEYGHFFEYMGYKVKCFNIYEMDKGNHYNPFRYIHGDKDIQILVTTLISNTTPPDSHSGDPFWEKSETALLVALIAFLYHYCTEEMQNFTQVMKLLRAAEIDENDSTAKSRLDEMFEDAALHDPEGFAITNYKTFKMGAGKTLKSILISCAVRLQSFDLEDVMRLTASDDLDLDSVGDEKTALFVIIPTGEKTFNFLAAMMYSQLFQRLYGYSESNAKFSQLIIDSDRQVWKTFRADSPKDSQRARAEAEAFFERAKQAKIQQNEDYKWWEMRTDRGELVGYRGSKDEAKKALEKLRGGKIIQNSEQSNHGERVPVHVRFMLDEFANTGRIPEFSEKVATIRKYEISVTIILQSLQQLKNLYEKDWETITANCDSTAYLGGGADTSTLEWLPKLMGKETLRGHGESFGKSGGSMSINEVGADLYSVSDLRTMNENDCIIIVRAQDPYKGPKYQSHNHPRRKLVLDLEKRLGSYRFNQQKAIDLENESTNSLRKIETKKGSIDEIDQEGQDIGDIREALDEVIAKEYRENKDIVGEEIIHTPTPLARDIDDEGIEETVLLGVNEDNLDETISTLMAQNEDLWGVSEVLYESMPAGQ